MSCNNCAYYNCKSAQTAYNDTTQTIASTGTTANVLGSLACDTGRSIETVVSGFNILTSGIYRISYDISYTAGTDPGTATFQLYNGTVALPCSIVNQTAVANGVYNVHLETVLNLSTCAMIQPSISAKVSGLAGSVTHVCASVMKV